MRKGFPCNENRFFPVRIDLQGVPCKSYRVWVYSIDNIDSPDGIDSILLYCLQKYVLTRWLINCLCTTERIIGMIFAHLKWPKMPTSVSKSVSTGIP